MLKKVVSDCKPTDVFNESFYDNLGNKIDVLCVHSNKFVSVYQGRTYVKRYRDAFNDDYSVNIEPMIEFVSEMFREYWLDPNNLKMDYPEYYRLIEDAVK